MKIRTKFMFLNVFLVTVAITVTTAFSLWQINKEARRQASVAQESHLRTFWKLLETKGKEFRTEDGKLLAGTYVINGNNELPDTIKEIFGGTATIFMGDKRISTNVLLDNGNRAVGTRLQGPAYDAIFKEGKAYRGETLILGVPYYAAYDPIRNGKGEIIGALYVGIKKGDFFTAYESHKTGVLAIALAVIVIFGLVSIVLVRRVLNPLNAMVEKLREIHDHEKGITDLNKRLNEVRNDEIGKVAGEFNSLLDNLNQIITMVMDVTQTINSYSGKMSATVHQQASFTSELSSSVIEISATMEEFSSTAAQIAEHSQGVVEIAGDTLQQTRAGAADVETLTEKMREISLDNQANIEEIVELGKKSKEITKIMGIINTIANQTKLIAFNAALEAASAGEAGKRFGVVAVEIRRLADNVFESTGEIEGKITEIMDAVNRLVIASEKSSKGIREGLEYSNHTTDMLNDLVSGVESTNDAAKQISLSTQQQQAASSQVVVALKDIEEGVCFSSSAIQQTLTISKDLADLSENLRQLVGKFNLAGADSIIIAANTDKII